MRANFFYMKGSGKKAVVKHLLNFTVVVGFIAAGTLSRIVLSVVEQVHLVSWPSVV